MVWSGELVRLFLCWKLSIVGELVRLCFWRCVMVEFVERRPVGPVFMIRELVWSKPSEWVWRASCSVCGEFEIYQAVGGRWVGKCCGWRVSKLWSDFVGFGELQLEVMRWRRDVLRVELVVVGFDSSVESVGV